MRFELVFWDDIIKMTEEKMERMEPEELASWFNKHISEENQQQIRWAGPPMNEWVWRWQY